MQEFDSDQALNSNFHLEDCSIVKCLYIPLHMYALNCLYHLYLLC